MTLYYISVTGSGDNAIRIFQESEFEAGGDSKRAPNFDMVAVAYESHTQDVNSVAWCPSESGLLASCSDDGTIKLWKVEEEG